MTKSPVAIPSDLKSRDEWRNACLDLFFFVSQVCPEAFDDKFHDLGRIHMDMCDFLDVRRNPSHSKYMSAFRGSFKTTVILGYFAWFFCLNLARRRSNSITYNTAIKENAWNFHGDLRHLLLNNGLMQWIFPELPHTEKDFGTMTKNRIEHKRVRMDFTSMDTTQASKHTENMFNDDLENEKNYQTEGQRNDLLNSFMYQQSVLTKVQSKGVGLDVFVGTPYHIQGLTWKVRNDKTYSHLEIPCYVNRNKELGVTFPERFTVSDFEVIRNRQNAQVFASQYLLSPLAEEDALCPEHWLRNQYWNKLPDPAWRSMVVDPGGAEAGENDPTGITIVDSDVNGNMYVVLADEFHLTPIGLMDKIAELKQNYEPDDIRIEKDRYSTTIADLFQHRFPLINVSYVEHKGRNKEQRIWRLKQWFEGKRIFVGHNQTAFISQLLEYPSVNHDDILDSLAYHIDIRRVPEPYQIHRLPSGKSFEPNISADFEKELEEAVARTSGIDQARENDHVY